MSIVQSNIHPVSKKLGQSPIKCMRNIIYVVVILFIDIFYFNILFCLHTLKRHLDLKAVVLFAAQCYTSSLYQISWIEYYCIWSEIMLSAFQLNSLFRCVIEDIFESRITITLLKWKLSLVESNIDSLRNVFEHARVYK